VIILKFLNQIIRHPLQSVNAKISLGFTIVLLLHISIVWLNHIGLEKADYNLQQSQKIHQQVDRYDEIDRVVSELQRQILVYTFSGFQGPEIRTGELQRELATLLDEAELATEDVQEQSDIRSMRNHALSHQEIFEMVIVDRAKRKKLLNVDLKNIGDQFERQISELDLIVPQKFDLQSVNAAFQAAKLNTLKFVYSPDSSHFRKAKTELNQCRSILTSSGKNAAGDLSAQIQSLINSIDQYENALIQMIQATRGYLHLVNVVLTGESEELKYLATSTRMKQAQRISSLEENMSNSNRQFANASNIFSIATILLGIIAAWLISRDIVPPIQNLAATFRDLANGKSCELNLNEERNDELGLLSKAACVFNEKAQETESLLSLVMERKEKLRDLNLQLEEQSVHSLQMAEKANAAAAAKTEFLANMSHEIRSPLTAIIGYSEILLEQTEAPEACERIMTIQRNGKYLLALINDILDLSKIESGKMESELIPVEIRQLVDEVIELVRPIAESGNIDFSVEYSDDLPVTIISDPTRLRQILINLLSNAYKFTHRGSVQLKVRKSVSDQRDEIQFDIIDTGIGISEEHVNKLFQTFTQADSSTSRRYGGSGLGLAICDRLSKIMNGRVELVSSTVDQGSHFRFTLYEPIIVDQSASPINKSSESPILTLNGNLPALSGFRILLAEDSPDNQKLISYFLEKAGAQVDIADTGLDAIQLAKEQDENGSPYSCILMDIQMPEMDGLEATRILRQNRYSHPIIALTANVMNIDQTMCLIAGCDAHMGKPVKRQELIKIIHKCSQTARSLPCEKDQSLS